MKKKHIVIATRESPLALCQAKWVKDQIAARYGNLTIELLGITTQADKQLSLSLSQVGGKGLFVKELEQALLEKRADIAVHSTKDMPMEYPPGLYVPIVCEREDARDVFISNYYSSLEALPIGACVGTSSLRRQSQLRAIRPDLIIENLRGNVNTRLKRLDEGDFDAIILAAAGIKRLGLTQRVTSFLSVEDILPAVGQGALAIECREDDGEIQGLIQFLNHLPSFYCIAAERAMCQKLGGGCQVPIAAFAEVKNQKILLKGLVGSVDGKIILRAQDQGDLNQAAELGKQVADHLLQQGAYKILREFTS